MDCNLNKIIHGNKLTIRHGSISKACSQAEDYLIYILGFDREAIEKEMNIFVTQVKTMRRKVRAKKENQAHR